MNITFKKEGLVNKTFDKATTWVKGQNFAGIKWRKFESRAGKKEGEPADIKTTFELSKKLFDSLNLEGDMTPETSLGLFQYDADPENGVICLLVADNEQATMLNRTGRHKDGVAKGKVFTNTYLDRALFGAGILEDTMGVQFLTLERVDMPDAPEWVHEAYMVVKDNSSNEETSSDTVSQDTPSNSGIEADPAIEPSAEVPQESGDDFEL